MGAEKLPAKLEKTKKFGEPEPMPMSKNRYLDLINPNDRMNFSEPSKRDPISNYTPKQVLNAIGTSINPKNFDKNVQRSLRREARAKT